MAETYKRASRVIVWLGRERKDSSPEILALNYLGEQFKVTVNGFYLLLPDTEQTEWHRSEVARPYDEWTWKAIRRRLLMVPQQYVPIPIEEEQIPRQVGK
jgi:hypothetical protein